MLLCQKFIQRMALIKWDSDISENWSRVFTKNNEEYVEFVKFGDLKWVYESNK